jgi:hypothetical protein
MPLLLQVARHGARIRRIVARHPSLRWLPIAVCAAGFVASVAAHRHDVDEARAAWSVTAPVLRALDDVEPGERPPAETVEYPVAMIPARALASTDTAGFVARQRISAGEILTEADVVAAPMPGALIPTDWLAVPIAESTASGAVAGDRVVVVSDGIVLAEGIVVAAADTGPLVAVPADVAPLVALANASGVTLLRTPFVGP